jgi:hypothetical protein
MNRRTILLTIATGLVGACASDNARFTEAVAPPKGRAAVYIYRNDVYIGYTNHIVPNIRVNRDLIGPLTKGGFFRVVVDPGPVEVAIFDFDWSDERGHVRSQNAVVTMQMAGDSTHFVEFALDRFFFRFSEKPASAALALLPELVRLN